MTFYHTIFSLLSQVIFGIFMMLFLNIRILAGYRIFHKILYSYCAGGAWHHILTQVFVPVQDIPQNIIFRLRRRRMTPYLSARIVAGYKIFRKILYPYCAGGAWHHILTQVFWPVTENSAKYYIPTAPKAHDTIYFLKYYIPTAPEAHDTIA